MSNIEMTITDSNEVHLKVPFDMNPFVKGAGFRWDWEGKYWRAQMSIQVLTFLNTVGVAVPQEVIDQYQNTIIESRSFDADIEIPVPDGLALRPFQKAGVRWALQHPNTFIGDDMGLGKTVQAVGVINSDESIKKVLVVCPLSVSLNWRDEINKWQTRGLSVGVLSSKNLNFPDTDVVIGHWGIMSKVQKQLRERKWDLIVLDESHYAKNPKAQRTKAIIGDFKDKIPPLQAGRKIALSGTPIPNRPIELYSILKWLDPQVSGTWMHYATRYCDGRQTRYGWDVSGASHLDELQQTLRSSILIRRLKSEVLTELPPKTRQVIKLSLDDTGLTSVVKNEQKIVTSAQAAISKAKVAVELAKAESDEAYKKAVEALREAQSIAFAEMSKARHDTALAKVPSVVAHLQDLLEDDEQKIVVFAHHRDVIQLLRENLETPTKDWSGVKTVSIVGGDSPESRLEAVHSFQDNPSVRVFLGSIGAAREGITLTAADIAVFAEIDWVPGNLSQAEDRIFRIGQKKPVTIQHVLLDKSIDAGMIQTIIHKQEVLDQALDTITSPLVNGTITPEPVSVDEQVDDTSTVSSIVEDASTHSTTRSQIEMLAEYVSDAEREVVHSGLRKLSETDNDRAMVVNGVGFSRIDVSLGHGLAERQYLSNKQVVLGAKLLVKYKRQLGEEATSTWNVLVHKKEEQESLTTTNASVDANSSFDKGDAGDSDTPDVPSRNRTRSRGSRMKL